MPLHSVGRQDRHPLTGADAELGQAPGDLTGRQEVFGPRNGFPAPRGQTLARTVPHRRAMGMPPTVGDEGVNDRGALVRWYSHRPPLGPHSMLPVMQKRRHAYSL